MIKVYINLGYCTREEDFIFWDSYLNLESAIADMLKYKFLINKGLVKINCSFYELVPYLSNGVSFLPVDEQVFNKVVLLSRRLINDNRKSLKYGKEEG